MRMESKEKPPKRVAICVGCVCAKIARKHKYPLMCPATKYPCFAIRSDIMDDPIKREQMARKYYEGIPHDNYDVLDKQFVDRMKEAEQEVIHAGYIMRYEEADQ